MPDRCFVDFYITRTIIIYLITFKIIIHQPFFTVKANVYRDQQSLGCTLSYTPPTVLLLCCKIVIRYFFEENTFVQFLKGLLHGTNNTNNGTNGSGDCYSSWFKRSQVRNSTFFMTHSVRGTKRIIKYSQTHPSKKLKTIHTNTSLTF